MDFTELTNRKIMNAVPVLNKFQQARIPIRSSIRLSHTLSALEDKTQNIQEKRRDIQESHQKTNEDGEVLFNVDGTKLKEDEDLDSVPDEVTVDHRLAQPNRPAVEDQEAFAEDMQKLMDDTVEVEVHQFPEEELEEVSVAYEEHVQEGGFEEDELNPGFRAQDIRPIIFMFPTGE